MSILSNIPGSLSPKEAYKYLQENAAIVDIRPEYETNFRMFDVSKVYYISFNSYQDNYKVLPNDILLIIADSVGTRSNEVVRFLISHGYTLVTSLAGGIVEWDHDSLPLAKDVDYEMVGGCACRLHPQKLSEEGSSITPSTNISIK